RCGSSFFFLPHQVVEERFGTVRGRGRFAEAGLASGAAPLGRARRFGRARFAETAGGFRLTFGGLFPGPGLAFFEFFVAFVHQVDERPLAGPFAFARLGAVEVGDAAGIAFFFYFVLEAGRQRHQGAAEVAVFVEAVRRGGGVVDQFGEAVPAAGLLQADEELRQFFGRDFAALRQLRGLAHHWFCFGEYRARFFARRAEALQRHRRRFRERGQLAGRVGQRWRRDAELFEQRRARVGEFLQVVHRLTELGQEGGELLQRFFEFGAVFGGRFGGFAGVGEE